jgi:hypothetical protein
MRGASRSAPHLRAPELNPEAATPPRVPRRSEQLEHRVALLRREVAGRHQRVQGEHLIAAGLLGVMERRVSAAEGAGSVVERADPRVADRPGGTAHASSARVEQSAQQLRDRGFERIAVTLGGEIGDGLDQRGSLHGAYMEAIRSRRQHAARGNARTFEPAVPRRLAALSDRSPPCLSRLESQPLKRGGRAAATRRNGRPACRSGQSTGSRVGSAAAGRT